MSRQLRITVTLVAVIVATFVVGYSVAAQFVHPNLRPPGQSRYGLIAAEDPQTTTSTSFVAIPNLSTTITVPAGKTADLIMAFSGELNGCSAIEVRAVIDGLAASPSFAQVFWPFSGSGSASHGFTFIGQTGSGVHSVGMQWEQLGGAGCNNPGDHAFISHRSLVLTVNVR